MSHHLLFIWLKWIPFGEGIRRGDTIHLLLVLLVLDEDHFRHGTAIYQDIIHLAVYRIIFTTLYIHILLKFLFRIVLRIVCFF